MDEKQIVNTPADKLPETETPDYKSENEALKAQLKDAEDRLKKAENEKKEAEKARMSESEKKKAEAEELEKMKADTLNEYKMVHLQRAGLGEEYISLITGSTRDEIAANGELVKQLVEKVRSETEAEVKKSVARTGAPGQGSAPEEVDATAFYESLIKEAKGNV